MAKLFVSIIAAILLISICSGTLSPPTISGPTAGQSDTILSFTSKLNASWTVPAGQTKTMQLTATWSDGSQTVSSASFPVTITGPTKNQAPTIPSIPDGSLICTAGQPYWFSTHSVDPEGNKTRITMDWGDNTTTTSALFASGATVRLQHTWTMPENTRKYEYLRAKATDEAGLSSPWSNPEELIIVGLKVNHPPTTPLKPIGPTVGFSNQTYAFSTSSTDPEGDKIKYCFDFGMGNTWTGYLPSGQVATASYRWSNVPKGKTYTYDVRASSADYRDATNSTWSPSLQIKITGV